MKIEFGVRFPGLEVLGVTTSIELAGADSQRGYHPHAQSLRDQAEVPSRIGRHLGRDHSRSRHGNPRTGRKGNGYRR